MSRTNSYGFLGPCQNLEKISDTIQRKRLERWKEMDRPYFIRTLTATSGGPNIINGNLMFYIHLFFRETFYI